MNILFINTSRAWGGNEKWTQMAAHELARRNKVFLAFRDKKLGRRFQVSRIRLPFVNRLDLYTLVRLVIYIKKHRIRIIVSTNRKYYLLGALAAGLTGCRHFVRCGIVWKVPDTFYYRMLFTRLIQGVIVNANPVREKLVMSGPVHQEMVHLVYNGLDISRLEKSRSEARDMPFRFNIVSSGELVPRKGHAFLLESFARFMSENPGHECGVIIMGKGKQKKKLKLLAEKLGLQDRVIFPGFLENPYPLLSKADLFVLASSNEGLSNALLEAMYLGVPVITTPAGGAGDIINHGDNGFLVEHGNHEQMAGLIHWSVSNRNSEALREVGKTGSQTVRDRFSLEKMGKSLEEIFKSSLNSVRG
jgi:glycosyltransferase involved in cell wall biosynthesis